MKKTIAGGNYQLDSKLIYKMYQTNVEREEHCRNAIQQLLDDVGIEMTVDEFIKTYSSNRGVKKCAVNVWKNIYKWQLHIKGNHKHLINILEDKLNFLQENPKFNQSEYVAEYNKKNYKHYHLKVNINNIEVINKLSEQANKNAYIMSLIENDIKKSTHAPKK